MDTPVKFGYWKIRGKAHILRMVLQHFEIPYEEQVYDTFQSFFTQHKQIAHMAHNLPYLKDGQNVVYDLMPAMIYLAKKYDKPQIVGKGLKDQTTVDMFNWDVAYLFKKLICSTFWKLPLEQQFLLQQKVLKENVWPILSKIQSQLSFDRKWIFEYVSWLDFSMLQLVLYIDLVFPGKTEGFPRLKQVTKNVLQLPKISKLQSQPRIKQLCFLPKDMCSSRSSSHSSQD